MERICFQCITKWVNSLYFLNVIWRSRHMFELSEKFTTLQSRIFSAYSERTEIKPGGSKSSSFSFSHTLFQMRNRNYQKLLIKKNILSLSFFNCIHSRCISQSCIGGERTDRSPDRSSYSIVCNDSTLPPALWRIQFNRRCSLTRTLSHATLNWLKTIWYSTPIHAHALAHALFERSTVHITISLAFTTLII